MTKAVYVKICFNVCLLFSQFLLKPRLKQPIATLIFGRPRLDETDPGSSIPRRTV